MNQPAKDRITFQVKEALDQLSLENTCQAHPCNQCPLLVNHACTLTRAQLHLERALQRLNP